MSFLFQKCLLVEVIYLLIRYYKTKFLQWTINNTDRNGVNKQKTYTDTHAHTNHSKKDNTGKAKKISMKISKTPLF